ncbi:MAG: right-handed parallel beta-helix repeat-containing protein [Sedimentisphaerales bacterium]|nr:right-handed parallel beta-helix repeat-containing protein [Sedimentisphaerales bacterium]
MVQTPASAAVYYLDAVNGNDTHSGTSDAPWKTLTKAQSAATDGDTLILKAGHYGTYTESKVARSDWVTYKAAPGAEVTFDRIELMSYDPDPTADYPAYLQFEGITIETPDPNTTAVRCHTVHNVRIYDCDIVGDGYAWSGSNPKSSNSKGIYCFKAHDIDISDCHIYGNGNSLAQTWPGIEPNDPGTIADARLHGQGWVFAIYAYPCTGGNFQVRNCLIEQCETGIFLNNPYGNEVITGNVIRYFTNDAIAIGGGRNNLPPNRTLVAHNTISHGYGFNTADGTFIGGHIDCIQLFGTNPDWVDYNYITIQGNRIFQCQHQAMFFNVGGGSHDWLIENNLVYKVPANPVSPAVAVWLYAADNIVFRNNTVSGKVFFTQGTGSVEIDDISGNIIDMLDLGTERGTIVNHENYNVVDQRWIDMQDHTMGAQSVVLNSQAQFERQFADFDNGDYRLVQNSFAVNRAVTSGAPASDIDGTARDANPDAGCFEYYGPVMADIGDVSAEKDEFVTFSVSATDLNGDPVTFSASGQPFDLGATFSGQTFAWNTSGVQAGAYQVTFVASDGHEYDTETVSITVLGDNQAPVLSSIGDKSATEEVRLGFSVNGTDGNGDPLSYSASGLPSGATFSGQSFAWTPATGQAGTYQVTFAVSDGLVSDSETITITVRSVAATNTPPVLAAIGTKSVNEAAYLGFSVSASDADGDSIAYSANNLPSGASFAGQSFRWTPTSAQVGSHQITFVASDGRSQDSETITVNVVSIGLDKAAPIVTRRSPEADAIQVTVNHLVRLHVTDGGRGVDADTVVIQVNGQTIYQGDRDAYASAYGRCGRSGTKSDYRFVFQPYESFNFDEAVTVRVSAADLEGNVMTPHSFSFVTEMRAFGNNWAVGADGAAGKGHPATASNTAGDIWTAWHAGADGGRDIYVSRLDAGADSFGSATRLTTSLLDQCNPDVAVGTDGSVYVVWQDNARGNWDVFVSVSADGAAWSRPVQVTDSNDNEVNPAIIVDSQSPNRVYVAWQDDRNGHEDIYVASSVSAFVNDTVSRVTTHAADQTDPDLTVDGRNVVSVIWTDMRAGQADLYGAASDIGPWTNLPLVTASGNQTDAAVATAPGGSVLHVLWSDDRSGNSDIYYARSEGLPDTLLTGSTIIDDTSRANQLMPAIACASDDEAFACWQDFRHATNGLDSDLFLAELRSGSAHTNVLIGDDGSNANQSRPAVGIDRYGNPYVVWTDDRDAADEIYYAATTFINPVPLDSKLVTSASGATIGPAPQYIDGPEDVSIIVPAGVCQTDVQITIAEILNPQALPVECLGSFDLGPSGVDFDGPVTVTIPYRFAGAAGSAVPYWYDGLTGALSQQGITDIKNLVIAPNLNALQFKTTHFTPFYLVVSEPAPSTSVDGGGGGGGCSVSATGNGAPQELLVPYGIVALIMAVLRRRDRKRRRSVPLTD